MKSTPMSGTNIMAKSENAFKKVSLIKLKANKKNLGYKYCCLKASTDSYPLILLGAELDDSPAEYTIEMKNCAITQRLMSKTILQIQQEGTKFTLNFGTQSIKDSWQKQLITDRRKNSSPFDQKPRLLSLDLVELSNGVQNISKKSKASTASGDISSLKTLPPISTEMIGSTDNKAKNDKNQLCRERSSTQISSQRKEYNGKVVSDLILKFENN